MSIFGEFYVSADSFALASTLTEVPEAVIEIDRVVASEETLTPYFWVSDVAFEAFETAADDDGSVENVSRLDTFEETGTALYRADWPDPVETFIYAYTQAGAVILEAIGQHNEWELRIRFDGNDAVDEFQSHCQDHDVTFSVERLYQTAQPRTGGQYGLTKKQQAALVTAWERGYFDTPRETTLAAVADELGITQQALSDRIRRAYDTLLANTLVVTSPPELGEGQ